MAVMNTLRDKMGKIVLIAIAVAMVAFIAGDVLGPNSFIFGRDDNVGEIANEDISYERYQNAIEERKTNYALQNNKQPTEDALISIRQQAWDMMVAEVAFGAQMDAAGLQVSDEEVWDLVQGQNIDPSIKQSFINPETKEFDREKLINFLKNIDQLAPQAKVQWALFEKNLAPGRRRIKYDNLMLFSNYVTEAEAKQEYNAESDVAEVKYLYVPYYAVSDSAVKATDEMLKNYLNKHKEEFEQEATKSIDFVSFSILPSATDSAFIKDELNVLKEEFGTVSDDSLYARANSDMSDFYNEYNIDDLPTPLQNNINNLSVGDVRGSFLENNYFKIYKVSAIEEDTVGTTRASHILFKWTDETDEAKAEAKAKAKDILRQISNGADFAEMAREHGTDGTAPQGGDLGWFTEGKKMVKEFEDAVFAQESKGLIRKVVETQYGYHLILLTEDVSYTKYKVATIAREIIASDATRDEAFRSADRFKSTAKTADDFATNAEKDSLSIQTAEDISANDRSFGGITNSRSVVQWAFRDASIGDVSKVFDLDNEYVIAVLTSAKDKGDADLEAVRPQIESKVKNKLKADIIASKLKKRNGDLDAKAKAYGSDANVYSSSDLKMNTTNLPNVGFAPEAIGTAFGMKNGQTSEPIALDNGIVIIELINKTSAPEVGDYTSYADQLKQRVKGSIAYYIDQAVKDKADIEDNRYKFY